MLLRLTIETLETLHVVTVVKHRSQQQRRKKGLIGECFRDGKTTKGNAECE